MKWHVATVLTDTSTIDDIITAVLHERGITTPESKKRFIHPTAPDRLSASDVGIDKTSLDVAIGRIRHGIQEKQSIVVYSDYDADGITGGAIMWEVLHRLGANVMPYVPDRETEGYGLSQAGIDNVKRLYDPALIITVDHGITAHEKVAYATSLGIDVIVTDHHTKPEILPDCPIVHTTSLAGSGVSWFVTKELIAATGKPMEGTEDYIALAAIGTIADLVPLVGPNRTIAKYGLEEVNKTNRVGLEALLVDAAVAKGDIETYTISHILAPRINAMGRLEHGLDALRLLCTTSAPRAMELARTLGLTNLRRQEMTQQAVLHALGVVQERQASGETRPLLIVGHESYNPGIIGLVAGKLTENYYRPSIVFSVGNEISKASARSVSGVNIVETIRRAQHLLVDVGGHPMAAGFTIETRNLTTFTTLLEQIAADTISEDALVPSLRVDAQIPLASVDEALWDALSELKPYGAGNPTPVFSTNSVSVLNCRLVGKDRSHLKLTVGISDRSYPAIGFRMGEQYGWLQEAKLIDIAYTVDMNVWNGNRELQLKLKDIRPAGATVHP